jgi:hypothetical protein
MTNKTAAELLREQDERLEAKVRAILEQVLALAPSGGETVPMPRSLLEQAIALLDQHSEVIAEKGRVRP